MKNNMIATKGLLTVNEQIEILKLAKDKLRILRSTCAGLEICSAIKEALRSLDIEHDKNERLYKIFRFSGINVLIPSFTRENAVLSKIGEIRSGAYWWDTELSKGGLTNRLAFLDWLINELEKSKTIK